MFFCIRNSHRLFVDWRYIFWIWKWYIICMCAVFWDPFVHMSSPHMLFTLPCWKLIFFFFLFSFFNAFIFFIFFLENMQKLYIHAALLFFGQYLKCIHTHLKKIRAFPFSCINTIKFEVFTIFLINYTFWAVCTCVLYVSMSYIQLFSLCEYYICEAWRILVRTVHFILHIICACYIYTLKNFFFFFF